MSSPLPARSTTTNCPFLIRPRLEVVDGLDEPTDRGLATQLQPCEYWLKRQLDVCLAGITLLILSPLLLATAVAIKLTSRGPVFYRQQRLGIGERPFTILKFRSMRVDADRIGPAFTRDGDPRITAVGRIIRRTSVDELPQLINVLVGDMSLIGPRPYIGFELESWSVEDRTRRASARPGISGMSQAFGRSANTVDQSRALDIEYTRECSLFLDARIVARTFAGLFSNRGTN